MYFPEKFITKARPADCIPTQTLWAIGYSKQLVSVRSK